MPFTSTGGHAVAHAPEHALFVPTSALNKYSVSPAESTRIRPKPVLATRTSVVCAGVVVRVDAGRGDAVAAVPPPPQAATANAASGITAPPARKVMGLLCLMSLLRSGSIESRSNQQSSNHAARSPRPRTLVVADALLAAREPDPCRGCVSSHSRCRSRPPPSSRSTPADREVSDAEASVLNLSWPQSRSTRGRVSVVAYTEPAGPGPAAD